MTLSIHPIPGDEVCDFCSSQPVIIRYPCKSFPAPPSPRRSLDCPGSTERDFACPDHRHRGTGVHGGP